ncbi:hypothetical protein ACOV11_24710 [Vibrio natriegens]
MSKRLKHILQNVDLMYDADRLRIKEKQKHRIYAKKKTNGLAYFCRSTIRRLEANDKGNLSKYENILGYTEKQFKKHIESQFERGMSWSNRGEWHIDHIKPISAFLKEGICDIKIINNLHNLQPLWAEDNLKKSNNYHP